MLGRPFFTEIAPCTNVQAMAGWVAKARKAGAPARTRIEFVFQFPHGKELVDVGLVYDPGSKLVHILVHGTA